MLVMGDFNSPAFVDPNPSDLKVNMINDFINFLSFAQLSIKP